MNLLRCPWRMLMLLKLAHYSSHVRSSSRCCEWQVQHQVILACNLHAAFRVCSGIGSHGAVAQFLNLICPLTSQAKSEHCLCIESCKILRLLFFSSVVFSFQGFPFSEVFLFLKTSCCSSFWKIVGICTHQDKEQN